MGSLRDAFKTDIKSASEGIEIKLNQFKNEDETVPTFKIAIKSAQNKKWLERARKVNSTLIAKYGVTNPEDLTAEQDREADVQLFVETILLGWENFEPDEDNVKLPYNKENAMKIFNDMQWHFLYQRLNTESSKQENFSFKMLDKIAKN